MPHLIFQARFPSHMQEPTAELSFFGPIEKETMEALQACTFATLQSCQEGSLGPNSPHPPKGFWKPSEYSPNVVCVPACSARPPLIKEWLLMGASCFSRHFVINHPGSWDNRFTLQNILRVVWIDTFESVGWTTLSTWNSGPGTDAPCQAQPAAGAGGTADDCASNSDAGGAGGVSATSAGASDTVECKGECASFLLFKRASAGIHPYLACACHVNIPCCSLIRRG